MRLLCVLLGFISGKWTVRCVDCANLDPEGKCYGHKMPENITSKAISCGFWKKK